MAVEGLYENHYWSWALFQADAYQQQKNIWSKRMCTFMATKYTGVDKSFFFCPEAPCSRRFVFKSWPLIFVFLLYIFLKLLSANELKFFASTGTQKLFIIVDCCSFNLRCLTWCFKIIMKIFAEKLTKLHIWNKRVIDSVPVLGSPRTNISSFQSLDACFQPLRILLAHCARFKINAYF